MRTPTQREGKAPPSDCAEANDRFVRARGEAGVPVVRQRLAGRRQDLCRLWDRPDVDDIYMRAESLIRAISWIMWLGIYPIASEAFGTRKPHVIRVLAAITVLTSVAFWVVELTGTSSMQSLYSLLLWAGDGEAAGEFHVTQLITHAFLHADIFHLAGNMLFLLVLGSRVNALVLCHS